MAVRRWFVYGSFVLPSELDPTREVYPNAPLQLVACEVGYVLAPGADINSARDQVYEQLEPEYPLPGEAMMSLTVAMGPQGATTHQESQGFRFLDRQKTNSVAATPTSVVIESSRYTRFEEFLERILNAVDAMGASLRIAAATRIGLRYIDEIPRSRLPEDTFTGYFTESVLAPGQEVPDVGEPAEFMTTSRFAVATDTHSVMRTGVLSTPVVAAQGPLTIPRPTTGPFFLIDIDSSWQALETESRAFDRGAISEVLYALHAPVRSLFEQSITDKLRNEVLRTEETE